MATKTNRALNRLMGRLSALRQTLRTEERDILDRFVLGATVKEVEAHRLNMDEPAVAKKVADRVNLKANAGAAVKRVNMKAAVGSQPEVVAHRLNMDEPAVAKKVAERVNLKAAERVNMRVNMRVNAGAQPEVVAHGPVSQEDKKVADRVNMRVNARLDWDADKKQYRVAD